MIFFFFLTLKARQQKQKIQKQDYIRLKICIAKKIVNKMKRQTTEQEKTFASQISDKGLVYKIYKEPNQINGKIHSQTIGLKIGQWI